MAYIIFGIICLAFWHLLWEGVFAPTIRIRLRYRLFALRDEFRRTLLTEPKTVDAKAASYLQDAMNTRIAYMDRLQLDTMYAAFRAYKNDESFRSKVESRQAVIHADPTTRKMAEQMDEIADAALAANMGGWFVYLVPIALALVIGRKLIKTINSVLDAPAHDVRRHVPRLASAPSVMAA